MPSGRHSHYLLPSPVPKLIAVLVHSFGFLEVQLGAKDI